MKRTSRWIAGVLLTVCGLQAAELYVSLQSGNPVQPFADWDTAATDIQSAVNAAADGDTIYIGPGVYTAQANSVTARQAPNVVTLDNKFLRLVGHGGRDRIVIDGEGVNRGVCIDRSAKVDAYTNLIQGITIRNGAALGSSYGSQGAGVFLYAGQDTYKGWSLQMVDCVVVSNTASGAGAGVGMPQVQPEMHLLFSNCVFKANIVDSDAASIWRLGGAINAYSEHTNSTVEVYSCHFEDSNGGNRGGGMYIGGGDARIYNCIFKRNIVWTYQNAGSGGGGIQCAGDARMDIRNCLFAENSSNTNFVSGGGIASHVQNAERRKFEIRNSTFWGNKQAAFYQRDFSKNPHVEVWNSIFYDNDKGDMLLTRRDTITNMFRNSSFSNTNFTFKPVMVDVVEGDPKFVDPENGDFHLMAASPGVGTGLYEGWMADAVDLEGRARASDGRVDMGAYAFKPTGCLLILR